MKAKFLFASAFLLVALAPWSVRADDAKAVDIKRVAPSEAFLAVYAHHNPERDYQRKYFAEVWQTIEDEHLLQRFMNITISNVPPEQLAAAKAKWQEVATALEPINIQALLSADEFVLAEVMEAPSNQILFAVRLTPAAAADWERGAVQACQLVSRWTEGKLTVENSRVKDASLTALQLPQVSPFQPAVARLNDVVVFSTSTGLLRRSMEQLQDGSAKSKFDDPRLQEALTHLPKPKDSLMFFDGRQLFQNLHGIGAFIRGQAKDNPQAARAAQLIDRIVNETAILDYEATVETTEPGQNRVATFGKLADDYQGKLLGRVLQTSKPVENWQKWIPKDASAYAISSGISLHELYAGITKLVKEEFPESQPAFDKFTAVQEKIGVNLDRDILQSFTGESVSVSLPVKAEDGTSHTESVSALKCSNPDKIRELLGRAVAALNQIPAVQMQQLRLEDCPDLAGFQKLHATIFQLIGAEPVIGFQDGWLIFASTPHAVEQLLAVRAGKAASIDGAASFQKFGINAKEVNRVSYTDIGANLRQVADVIDKIAAMGQIGMAAMNAKPEQLKPALEFMSLLPSVAKVVRKFDFLGHNLSVSRNGPLPGTYVRDSVTEVRLPK